MALAAFCGPAAAGIACRADAVTLTGDFGEARFRVEIADDNAERAQGLMNRESLPRGAGMLFIYDRPGPASFWMRNTLIPLDMIFLDETGTVLRVHENAVPLDESPIFGGDNVLAVLEINGGLAGAIGIGPGDRLSHPALPQDRAAAPCAAE
ncbi:DUF192 domain-containing protein [Palleronia sediminis]|uniref:DUF192 domain-containing protein n=1 Tax=Palleronia sediminis TaxID=2547833 RepID=UPI001F0F9CBC|nr:DUF192 domain-containing protein [Palleronia sediminis]